MRQEAFGDREAGDLYWARDPLGEWVKYYDDNRLDFALNYLRPVDYYI